MLQAARDSHFPHRSPRTGVIRGVSAPRRLASRARLALVAGDVTASGLAAAAAAALGSGRTATASALTAAALLLAAIVVASLYEYSFAMSPRDEMYALALPCCLAVAAFLVLTAMPGLGLDRVAGLATISAGFAGCAAVRALLHGRLVHSQQPRSSQRPSVPGPATRLTKRGLDIALTLIVAPLAAVIGGAVALVILIGDGGPVFFRQERAGLGGRPFRLYKFRTMKVDAGDAWAVAGDARITRSGRFLRRTSLDELPQLINVLRGEMSLVGPRPEMLSYAADFSRRIPRYAERFRVKPGVTGWAQVTLPRILTDADMADIAAADAVYVEHCSIVLDAIIIAKTAAEVLFHRAG